jgi:hypothetical protein
MKKVIGGLCTAFCALVFLQSGNVLAQAAPRSQPTVFISSDGDFQTALAAAMIKKNVPVVMVSKQDGSEYTLKAAAVYSKDESGAGKIARCIFASCAGMNGFSSVSVELIRTNGGAVVWAYQVRKANSGPLGIQSLSEAVVKHLKNDYLSKHKG